MNNFKIFGKEHFIIMGFYLVFTGIILYVPNFSKKLNKKKFAVLLGYALICTKLLEYLYKYFYLGVPLKHLLPLHICNYTLFLVGIMLIKQSYTIFRFSYFWSVGAIAAILLPDLTESFPDPLNISFFFSHFVLLAGVLYSIKYFSFRPRFRDCVSSFILLNVILSLVLPINFLLDTNFMYLSEPPLGDTFSFLGEWPVYIIYFDIFTFILFLLMYMPFSIYKRDS